MKINIFLHNSRFDELSSTLTTCRAEPCYAGYSRIVTTVKSLMEDRKSLNPIYLNAGDYFQGTLWYSIFRWNITSYFLNLLPADAMVIETYYSSCFENFSAFNSQFLFQTIGNHEFDHSIAGLLPFLEKSRSPVVVANIIDETMELRGLIQNSIVIDKYKRKIGIIGVTIKTTERLSNVGKLRFSDEIESVRKEADLLRSQGVNIIIVLSHCGLDLDRQIAAKAGEYIDVIVGGHSHTFLYTGVDAPGLGSLKLQLNKVIFKIFFCRHSTG